MTRVTNFGLKRTHLEAGFSNDETPSKGTALPAIHDPTASSEAVPPPKKKRKRTPKSKRDGNLAKSAVDNTAEARESDSLKRNAEDLVESTIAPATGKSAKRNKKSKERRKKGMFFPKHG